jgi:hypothetical protein
VEEQTVLVPNRKVLKLGVTVQELDRFVQAHKDLRTETLSATLGALLDCYEQTGRKLGTFLPASSFKETVESSLKESESSFKTL